MSTFAIRVSYFAAARDLAGVSEEEVSLSSDVTTIGAAFALLCTLHPRLLPYQGRLAFAKNGEHARTDEVLEKGDELSILPPVAGGSRVVLAEVRATKLSVDEVLDAVRHPGAGGVAIFLGVVRDHADGKRVASLSYEAHPTLAPKDLMRVLEEVCGEHPNARLAACHRTGHLVVGDTAVIIAASAPHRDEAFAACRKAIDRIKEVVPIWKEEFAADGTSEWVNFDPRA